jgi:hypothetical protein
MAAIVGNTGSSPRPHGSPDDVPKTISAKAAGSAAQGVSGESPGGVGTTPPAPPVATQSTTVSLAPGSSEPPAPEVLDAAQARLTAAASGGPTANYNSDLLSIALTPLAALRALFKAALESNEHQQDDALEARKRELEIARGKQLAAASENTKDAGNIDSNRWKTLTLSCAGACATVGAAAIHTEKGEEYWTTFGVKTEAILDGAGGGGKGFESMAAFIETGQKADSKVSDATVALYQADNDQAKGNVSDMNDMSQRLRQQFQQMADAMKEIRDSHAQSIRIA